MSEKRGQVTIFIIIGVVILIAAFLIIFAVTRTTDVDAPEKILRETPTAVRPVRLYVDQCIEVVSRDALENMGTHAGWILTDDPDITQVSFDISYDATDSEGVEFTTGGAKIPYWYYLKSDNECQNCIFSNENVPTEAEMTSQINRYVSKRLNTCLRDFTSLEEQGFEIKKGEIETETRFTANDVVIDVRLPLTISKEDKEYKMDDFKVILPVNMRKLYALATEILEKETELGFLEYQTMGLISGYSEVDANKLPPSGSAATIGPGFVVWSKAAVEVKIKEILATYTPLVTLQNTHNFYPYVIPNQPGHEIRQGIMYSFVYNLLEDNYDTFDVNFYYFNWPIYFDISPRDGDLIKPAEYDGNFLDMLNVFSKHYDYDYDISYPVVIELRDTDAFNGDGYSFLLALETNIRNNDALQPGELLEFGQLGSGRSMFSDEKQRISGDITVRVRSQGEPLQDATIRYICGENSVKLGTTDEKGIVVSKFPICVGGIVKATKNGYLGGGVYLDTKTGEKVDVKIDLEKVIRKNAKIQIIEPSAIDNLSGIPYGGLTFSELRNILATNSRDLNENETVFLTVEKVMEGLESPMASFASFEEADDVGTIQIIESESQKEYEVNIVLMDHEGFYIPSETRTYKTGEWPFEEEEEVDFPEIDMDEAPMGGANLNNNTGYWVVTPYDAQRDTVIFYALRIKAPTKIEEMERLGASEDMSKDYRSLVQPKWEQTLN